VFVSEESLKPRAQKFFIVAFYAACVKHHLSMLGIIATITLSACGGGGAGASYAPTQQPAGGSVATPAPTNAPALLQTASIGGSPAFVNSSQHPIYVFSGDTTNHSNCTGGCLSIWPAVPAPSGTLPAPFASFTRADNGAHQLSYNGAPLYTFVSDTQPDVATGNGVEGFSLARPSTATPAPTPSPSNTYHP
jgi:predicted lipoprotein with Yx(FWY)xxD motif